MMRISTFALLLSTTIFFYFPSMAQGQKDTKAWDKWKYLTGDWIGEGSSQPGEGTGYFSFKPDLDGKVMVRKNHSEYPATKDKPATVHDDLVIIYFNDNGEASKAIYFDNEGHVINYSVTFSDSLHAIILTSEIKDKQPAFRLTYTQLSDKQVSIKFEFAPPGKPGAFSTYLEGKAHKK
jgi:hypothetical protein